jgi:hypothetical protein
VPLTRNLVGRLSPHVSANVTARGAGVLLKRVGASRLRTRTETTDRHVLT